MKVLTTSCSKTRGHATLEKRRKCDRRKSVLKAHLTKVITLARDILKDKIRALDRTSEMISQYQQMTTLGLKKRRRLNCLTIALEKTDRQRSKKIMHSLWQWKSRIPQFFRLHQWANQASSLSTMESLKVLNQNRSKRAPLTATLATRALPMKMQRKGQLRQAQNSSHDQDPFKGVSAKHITNQKIKNLA